jgi:hypothetical protein
MTYDYETGEPDDCMAPSKGIRTGVIWGLIFWGTLLAVLFAL